jgi:hypothetical protein
MKYGSEFRRDCLIRIRQSLELITGLPLPTTQQEISHWIELADGDRFLFTPEVWKAMCCAEEEHDETKRLWLRSNGIFRSQILLSVSPFSIDYCIQ